MVEIARSSKMNATFSDLLALPQIKKFCCAVGLTLSPALIKLDYSEKGGEGTCTFFHRTQNTLLTDKCAICCYVMDVFPPDWSGRDVLFAAVSIMRLHSPRQAAQSTTTFIAFCSGVQAAP